jgi:hypothetical protein
MLQTQALGACTIFHTRQATSTRQDGVTSRAKTAALALGAIPGAALKSL